MNNSTEIETYIPEINSEDYENWENLIVSNFLIFGIKSIDGIKLIRPDESISFKGELKEGNGLERKSVEHPLGIEFDIYTDFNYQTNSTRIDTSRPLLVCEIKYYLSEDITQQFNDGFITRERLDYLRRNPNISQMGVREAFVVLNAETCEPEFLLWRNLVEGGDLTVDYPYPIQSHTAQSQ